jgi:hypothetical protein
MKASSTKPLMEQILDQFFNLVDRNFRGQLTEAMDSSLINLLNTANKTVFNKFNISPTDKEYFIAGSARLYLDTELRNAFNVNESLGDLDIIIPDKELWVNAGLEKEYNEGGVYKVPGTVIEVFTEWKPQIADPEKFKDKNVRSTEEILADANLNKGYYFMPLRDIVDYKTILDREKERQVVKAITSYIDGSSAEKVGILKKLINILGIDNAKSFFS